MNRAVVKTDSATTRIPELDFEIPAFSQKGGRFKVRIWVVRAGWHRAHFLTESLMPGLAGVCGFGHIIIWILTGLIQAESLARTA